MESVHLLLRNRPGLCPVRSISLVPRSPRLLQFATIWLDAIPRRHVPCGNCPLDLTSSILQEVWPSPRGPPGCLTHRFLKGPLDNSCAGVWGEDKNPTEGVDPRPSISPHLRQCKNDQFGDSSQGHWHLCPSPLPAGTGPGKGGPVGASGALPTLTCALSHPSISPA